MKSIKQLSLCILALLIFFGTHWTTKQLTRGLSPGDAESNKPQSAPSKNSPNQAATGA
jgi:hypothetical protein